MLARKALLLVLLVVAPAIAMGAGLRLFQVRTANNFLFDVMVESNMGMSNGLNDAYDGCYMLRVAGSEVRTPSATILYGGRGVQSPRTAVGNLFKVSRQVYVPTKGDWARYYDLIVNTSSSKQSVEVEVFGNLGSDSSTKVTQTSDNDLSVETSDLWFVTDDFEDGAGDPTLAHVFRRQGSKRSPERIALDMDNISIRYRLKLAPRGRAALVFFAVQTSNSTEATKLARELTAFGAPAKAHLSTEDIRRIQN